MLRSAQHDNFLVSSVGNQTDPPPVNHSRTAWFQNRLMHLLKNAGMAGGAEGALFQVNPFHRVGGSHGAAVVVAVGKVQSVSELVHGLFEQALEQDLAV